VKISILPYGDNATNFYLEKSKMISNQHSTMREKSISPHWNWYVQNNLIASNAKSPESLEFRPAKKLV
jgi:hypothetical protein